MNINTILKALSVVGAVAIMSLAFLGCHDETGKKEQYLKYSKYAGTTVGYVINASGKVIGPEVKTAITNVLTALVTELPKEVTAETFADDMREIATNAVAKIDIPEAYRAVVDKSVDTLLTLLQTALLSVKVKYPKEFGNAELFYEATYVFLDSVNSVIDIDSFRGLPEETAFIVDGSLKYEIIEKMAKDNGHEVSRKTFDDIIANIEKLTK